VEFYQDLWRQKTNEGGDSMLRRFDRTPTCDGQIDRQRNEQADTGP